jgi:pimeloyl-ACP methyl ester carboxylesterase
VRIDYEARGPGEPAIVFIHCWCGSRAFWKGQIDLFADERKVVAFDLPGHGTSGRDRKEWSVAGLGADVQAVVEALGLKEVILVGHSMGGPVALDVARRLPGRVRGIVAVDTLHNAEFVWSRERMDAIAMRFETDWDATMRTMVPQMFASGADPALPEWVIARAGETDRSAAIALMRSFGSLDLKQMFQDARVPIRAINAALPPPMGMETVVDINRKYAEFEAVIMDDVGHYPMLEKPAGFNAHLRHSVGELRAR